MKQVQGGLPGNPAVLFNLAKCAESDGRLDDAMALLAQYSKAAPGAYDLDEVQARVVILQALSGLPEPRGSLVRTAYTTAAASIDSPKNITPSSVPMMTRVTRAMGALLLQWNL